MRDKEKEIREKIKDWAIDFLTDILVGIILLILSKII